MSDSENGSPPLRGLDPARVSRWMKENVPGGDEALRYELVAAGGSNLTYRVENASGRRWALRRPPEGARVASAHDVGREWRILEALHRHGGRVPVPEPVAFCDDAELLGVPFFVMDFVDGRILRSPADGAELGVEEARRASESLIDVEVAMHRLDVEAAGLGDLGRKEGYVARQLRRWLRQFEATTSRELPVVHELHARLAETIPDEQRGDSLVHGDYRFDNTVLGEDCRVIAVLDWELCTLGDPVADFVWSILYWSDPEDTADFGSPSPTRHVAFPRRAEAIRMYEERSGFDLSAYDFYVAFSWWKMACLIEGVVARLRAGAGGGLRGGSPEEAMARVDWMIERARAAAERI